MSGRRTSNRIRGPQSALTDFLASHNISASRIRDTYEQRARAAATQNAVEDQRRPAEGSTEDAPIDDPAIQAQTDPDAQTDGHRNEVRETVATRVSRPSRRSRADVEDDEEAGPSSSKRRRVEVDNGEGSSKSAPNAIAAAAAATALKKKKAKKAAKAKGAIPDDEDDEDDDNYGEIFDLMGANSYKKAQPTPGQLEHCELCDKRFTVTAYSKTGPGGGLVCSPCGRKVSDTGPKSKQKSSKAGMGKTRRKAESNRLDGIVNLGSRSLQEICVSKIADHSQDIEEFGDMPGRLVSQISQIFSKRRIIDSRSVDLFAGSEREEITIHDCANLKTEDFKRLFATSPNIKRLLLENAGQFKDEVIEYMAERLPNLTHVKIHGANLVTHGGWVTLFTRKGHDLESVKLAWLDTTFTNETLQSLVALCPNLRELKIKNCPRLTEHGYRHIARLHHLNSLSLRPTNPLGNRHLLAEFIEHSGHQLYKLSLENLADAKGRHLIEAIRRHAGKLQKLRLEGLNNVPDAIFASLFRPDNANGQQRGGLPPLTEVDLSNCREIETNPFADPDSDEEGEEEREEGVLGVASETLEALMAHSGQDLRVLKVPSCRHIGQPALDAVFSSGHQYPQLETIDISFCGNVSSDVLQGIFQSCPAVKRVTAFGCFRAGSVAVPAGVAVVGVPNAQEDIVQLGGAAARVTDLRR